jgi:hypothetical protein
MLMLRSSEVSFGASGGGGVGLGAGCDAARWLCRVLRACVGVHALPFAFACFAQHKRTHLWRVLVLPLILKRGGRCSDVNTGVRHSLCCVRSLFMQGLHVLNMPHPLFPC